MIEKIDIPLDNLSGDLAATLAYWRDQGGDRFACTWHTFDLMKLPSRLIPTTVVIDVFDDTDLNVYRYWGSGMTRIHGSDLTGKSPYQIDPPDFANALRDQHIKTRQHLLATATMYEFQRFDSIIQRHTTLRLPLFDDEKTVCHIVAIVDPQSKAIPEQLPRFKAAVGG